MLIETNKTKPAFVLFALNLESKALELKTLADHGITKFKAVDGSYKGSKESAYLVPLGPLNGFDTLIKVHRLAKEFNQESILEVDVNRNAQLIYMDAKFQVPTKLGKFQNVSKFEAIASDAYTFDPSTNYYYIAK